MIDQIKIGNTHSFYDFEASVTERKNNKPKKKSIKETVPFSNITHDFSAINGEIYWEERELEYTFEITANSAEELEQKKQPFVAWIMNVMNEELHDPFIKDYHFLATYADMDEDDSEFEKSSITVRFTAYPYMISNEKKIFVCRGVATNYVTTIIQNDSCHRIVPRLTASAECSIFINHDGIETVYTLPAGEFEDERFMLNPGETAIGVKTVTGSGSVTVEFNVEVF